MTTSDDRPNEAPALAAFADVLRNASAPPAPAELDQGLRSVMARLAGDRARRWRWLRWSLAGVGAAICIVAAQPLISKALHPSAGTPRPMPSYRIEGGLVLEGGYLRAASASGMKLVFDEGSQLALAPEARARLRSLDQAGARVAIEQGSARFQVVPGAGRRWWVEAGPFLVTVTGTVFTVAWDPADERLELRLHHGRVVVSGPMSGGDIALRAGQRLVVNLPKAETSILEDVADDEPSEPGLAPREEERPAPRPLPREKATTSAAAPAAANGPKHERRWVAALAGGRWDRILEDVERAGIEATLAEASSEDLLALADAARYRRRLELARAALLAERRRFPGSPRSLDALFLLGRVEESGERGAARAIGWYDEYLARAPMGPYAAEALGRKMTLTHELEGPARAQPLAQEYLRRFPGGSYAGAAQALRRVP